MRRICYLCDLNCGPSEERNVMAQSRNVIKVVSAYSRKMDYLSKKIFNELPFPLTVRNKKLVDTFRKIPFDENDFRSNYYPPHPMFFSLTKLLRAHGLFRDEHQDFAEEFERQAVLRGKGRPKPGEGKRAKIRKQDS